MWGESTGDQGFAHCQIILQKSLMQNVSTSASKFTVCFENWLLELKWPKRTNLFVRAFDCVQSLCLHSSHFKWHGRSKFSQETKCLWDLILLLFLLQHLCVVHTCFTAPLCLHTSPRVVMLFLPLSDPWSWKLVSSTLSPQQPSLPHIFQWAVASCISSPGVWRSEVFRRRYCCLWNDPSYTFLPYKIKQLYFFHTLKCVNIQLVYASLCSAYLAIWWLCVCLFDTHTHVVRDTYSSKREKE